MPRSLGIDLGSVSVKLALLHPDGTIETSIYKRHKGRPVETALFLLDALLAQHGPLPAACAGAAGRLLARRLGLPHVNELTALTSGMQALHPEVRSIMEMGGEDAKLLLVDQGAVRDFALNSVCAAGTGSFLDQQAERMRLSIEEFAALALESRTPPRIAGRCSVFAKSDMIHLQQIATPLQDIVAGLCFAVARNFRGSIVRSRRLEPVVAFCGGVALNQGVVRAFKEVFGQDDLLVPQNPALVAALGAALLAAEQNAPVLSRQQLEAAGQERGAQVPASPHGMLVQSGDDFHSRHPEGCGDEAPPRAAAPVQGCLGIDIGSISTCLAVVDDQGRLVCKRYLRTASRPIEAVRQGLEEIRNELGYDQGLLKIRGVGATGSGRYMIADCVGADLVKNEITAQARGAVSLDALGKGAGVDTVLEIGGQDSKYIQLQDGVIVDFEMNKACAAGTGSFLEEQAEKLCVQVKGEFAGLALEARSPCALGERCTVFMENSLMSSLEQGAAKDDLLAGLAYSIVENYINRVVAGRPIGERVFFQGGTACNKAVVAAFEKYLGRRITVPEHNDVSGAIGMALLAREHMLEKGPGAVTAFKGFDLARRSYEQDSFECKGCDNRCEINRIRFEGDSDFLYYGGRCEKYDIRRQKGGGLPDLFSWRQQALELAHQQHAAALASGRSNAPLGVMGLPRVFAMFDYLPWHATLLWELGFEVRLSPPTDSRITTLGTQATLADTCFPVKAALGHVRSLLEQGVTRLWLPSFVNMAAPDAPESSALSCPLTQSFPYQARQAFAEARVLAPVLQRSEGRAVVFARLFGVLSPLGVRPWQLWRAMQRAEAAQQEFERAVRRKGRETLENLESLGAKHVLAVIGRGYNAMDAGMNLGVPRKLASLDTLAVPMDMLELASVHEDWPEMYWRSGQRMLAAARAVRRDPRLGALVIGSFSCGPDSFILEFLRTEMGEEPFLHIEVDEHSADAGVITRCEAFLDSLEMRGRSAGTKPAPNPRAAAPLRHGVGFGRRKVYIPRMGDHALGLKAAFEACGLEAEVMPLTDGEAMSLARRFVSGKECYPFAVTTADMLKTAMSPGFEPGRSAFFMPSGCGPCRFGQYNLLQKMILERAGFPETPILSPVQDSAMYSEMGIIGGDFARISWKGVVAFDLLIRCLHASRPYEREAGAADALYADALDRVPGLLAGDLERLAAQLGEYAAGFAALMQAHPEPRPRIGIVGEIFVRTNTFANEDLVRQVERLGGEAWLATVDEWIYYVNWSATRNALARRELTELARVLLKGHVQRRMAHRLEAAMNGLLKGRDPDTSELLRKAAPWLHHSFRGEAVLSVGKAVDMLERGVQGLVLAMPFGCMPGTVAASLLRGVCAGHGAPMIAVPYDGTASGAMRLQLETFMQQAAGRLAVQGVRS